MKTNIKLIQHLSDNNLIRYYAVWLRLKHMHVNSIVYNHSLSKLSSQSGISRNGLRKYIKFFIQKNWITQQDNNILFISHTKFKALNGIKFNREIKITKSSLIQTITNNLRFEILKEKQRKFNYVKSVISNRNNPTGKNALKKYKSSIKAIKNLQCNITTGEAPTNLTISLNKLSKLLNISPSSISRLIKIKTKQQKAVVIRDRILVASQINSSAYIPKNHFLSNGYVFKAVCNKYIFL